MCRRILSRLFAPIKLLIVALPALECARIVPQVHAELVIVALAAFECAGELQDQNRVVDRLRDPRVIYDADALKGQSRLAGSEWKRHLPRD